MSYDEESRLAELKNNVSSISPIKTGGRSAGSALGKTGKGGELSEPKSESNLSTPDIENYDEEDAPVKGFSTDQEQNILLKEPLSSSSLQEELDLIDP